MPEIVAPMPGKILAVNVQPGDRVDENTVCFVLESMKMEMPISPEDRGVVQEVKVKEGDVIKKDAVLAVIE